jgi:hypothetical protein
MTTPTGIQAVDRVLEQHGPFPDAETAEALAARLLAIWHALQPCSGGLDATTTTLDRRRQQTHRG